MTHLTLNCPTCRRRLVYVPLDGLTLHFRCDEHGSLIFKPLMQLTPEDEAIFPHTVTSTRRNSDAA